MSAIPAAPETATRDTGVFSPGVAIWMIAAAVVSAAVFVVLLAFGPKPRTGAYALSHSAVGYAGLVKLLGDEGVPVRLSWTQDLSRAAPTGVLVLTPDVGRELTALPPGPMGHVTVIVAPKWASLPYPKHRGWVMTFGAYGPKAIINGVLAPLTGMAWQSPSNEVLRDARGRRLSPRDEPFLVQVNGATNPVLHDADGFFTPGTKVRLGDIKEFQAFSRLPAGWERGLVDEQGRTVVAFDRQRRLFVISDPDILNTQGLAGLDGAVAATRILDQLRSGDEPVVFDLTLSGLGGEGKQGRYSALRLALTPPFLSATLCGVAAALLMGLHAAIRFGAQQRAVRTFALGKRALADNSAALIHMARRDASMAPGYAALTRELALEGMHLGRTDNGAAMTAQLDRIARSRGVEASFSELERDAKRVADSVGLMAAARALYRWRLEMTRGR